MRQKKDWDNAFTATELHGTVDQSPAYAGALSFMRRKYSRDLAGVDVAVTGIPLDTATTNRPGARFGPRAIRAASSIMCWERPWPWDFDPLERLAVIDYGDCEFDFGIPDSVTPAIQAHIAAILQKGAASLVLGGDHYVTYPVLKAHAEHHGQLSLIHFDAHSDTWPDNTRRVDHGTMFYHAVKEGIVDDTRSVQIGLRTTNDDTLGFNILDARRVHADGPSAIAAEIKRIVGNRKAYLTFDIDCLDPSYAPGTGTPVCGGLTSFQALEIIRGLAGINLVGMDLVEVAPAYDVGEITALAGAQLAAEFLCLYASKPAS
ncbi:MAG: agmatinase [Gammaproteobacteria bacterium]|nr:MAG: agmatinase [Gammaproteobacteria bacterium]